LAENAPDARYCERCGSELASADAATVVFDPRSTAISRSSGADAQSVSGGWQSGHSVSGQTAAALLLLARRELALDYDVEREIGRGGMAVVYRAVDRQLRRTVALKVLPPELALSKGVVERFQREAQLAAALDHPNIIPIYRVGQSASLLYLAMKHVEGRPLDAIVADQGALPIAVVLLVLRAGASALAYAHEHGIVHRDIKSGNILIDLTGRAIVTDFGVARAIDNASLTTTGSVIGTPYFMSPEQCAGKVAGPQSDQYSLGVVAFQMLTGAVPFQAETLAAIMHHHFFTPIPDLTKVREDVPAELNAILERILSKDPSRRYDTTAELRSAIEAVPLSNADREQGEAMLRGLARGSAMPRVETSSIPPLADTMAVVAAHDAFMRSAERFRRVRRRVGVLAGLAVTAGVVVVVGRTVSAPGRRSQPIPQVGPLTSPSPPTVRPVSGGSAAVPPAGGAEKSAIRSGASGAEANSIGRQKSGSTPGPASPESTAASRVSMADTATGKVRIRAIPGTADILIDGETVGQGAVLDRDVISGTKRLHITAPGYQDFDSTIVIRAGETTRLNLIELKAEP
jgi:hypothetical protein